jgi:hypothetical protein
MRYIIIHLQASKQQQQQQQQQQHTMTPTTSTKLYEQACIAQNIAQNRFNAARLSVPDELYWYNNHTNWDALDRKEFRDIMIRMETITVQYYEDFGTGTYPNRSTYPSAAIKRFWAEEWGCEYLPESGKWLDLSTDTVIKSETEKQDEKAQKKALKRKEKEALKALKEEEKKSKKALKQQLQQQQLQDAQFDEEEEAYAEAYAEARLAEEARWQEEQEQAQARAQKEQDDAQAYLDSFDYTSEEEVVHATQDQTPQTQVPCQGVLYIEELISASGDFDWRAFIYYDARIRRYVLKGTRRSLRSTSKKTVFPEVTLCFRSSRELASYLRSSTDESLNVSMYAMSCGALAGSTFGELYAQPLRGYKTELFGYDNTRPRYSTFVNYLRIVRDLDAGHSTFASN